MYVELASNLDCTGCEACQSVCPQNAISMRVNSNGFKYPFIDVNLCLECGMCNRICPVLHTPNQNISSSHKVYAAWSNNTQIRYCSTSGGIFSELSFAVLDAGGKVCGAAYRDDNLVEHKIVDDRSGIEKLRQSKYIQSDIGGVFRHIKLLLDNGELIMFVGSPCQVSGLKSYLRKNYDNLITIDFICRGMNSPKAYEYWLNDLEQKYKSKVCTVWFKYKVYGWKRSPRCTKIVFESGNECVIEGEANSFMRGYLDGNLYLRPSCSVCRFKGAERNSDITLADFWKIPNELDDDQGTSMVILNTKKGYELFEQIMPRITYHERSFEEISVGNVCFNDSVQLNPQGSEFLERLGTKSYDSLIQEYIPLSYKKRIKNSLRRIKNKIKR